MPIASSRRRRKSGSAGAVRGMAAAQRSTIDARRGWASEGRRLRVCRGSLQRRAGTHTKIHRARTSDADACVAAVLARARTSDRRPSTSATRAHAHGTRLKEHRRRGTHSRVGCPHRPHENRRAMAARAAGGASDGGQSAPSGCPGKQPGNAAQPRRSAGHRGVPARAGRCQGVISLPTFAVHL